MLGVCSVCGVTELGLGAYQLCTRPFAYGMPAGGLRGKDSDASRILTFSGGTRRTRAVDGRATARHLHGKIVFERPRCGLRAVLP